MISLYTQFASYWQAKGWMWLAIAAVSVLAVCWLASDRNNSEGSYDRFNVTVRDQQKYPELNYFPQSISSSSTTDEWLATQDPQKQKKQQKHTIPINSKGEEICRNTLQEIFKQPFPKCRPDFLFNSVTGQALELDMYNKHYGLAVEYNGQQHYKYNAFMHGGSKDKFYGQQYRDKMKRDVCKKLGIVLIEVPYTVKNTDIPQYLIQKLRESNIIN